MAPTTFTTVRLPKSDYGPVRINTKSTVSRKYAHRTSAALGGISGAYVGATMIGMSPRQRVGYAALSAGATYGIQRATFAAHNRSVRKNAAKYRNGVRIVGAPNQNRVGQPSVNKPLSQKQIQQRRVAARAPRRSRAVAGVRSGRRV